MSGEIQRALRGCLRGLGVFGAGKHDHVGGRGLCHHGSLACSVAIGRFLEEADGGLCDAAEITFAVGVDGAEEIHGGFFGQVGFLQNTLCGVDIGEVEGSSGMAGVEDRGKTDTGA